MTINRKSTIILIFFTLAHFSVEADPFCISIDEDTGDCELCAVSYLSDGVCVKPKEEIKRCLFYKDEEKCSSCKLGTYMTKSGTCEVIPIDLCVKINANMECTACNNTILVSNSHCQDQMKTCAVKNCHVCEYDILGKEICSLCKKGYALVNSDSGKYCEKLPERNQQCIRADNFDFPYCLICKIGAYFENGICYKSESYNDSIFSIKLVSFWATLIFVFMANLM